ncbi:MAG: Asp-tRNA(Asn)/Glu-tRNA(Gln) amidotransferase subunit GatA, partial [Desulfobacterales bacterium]|nr:Asp-tRNA(Asn)/Glu-tRNA(Gln) amidotransferase subunit GatA [Desulfobacterales bacterium]
MYSKTIAELAEGLKKGDFSSEELTKSYLERIKKYDAELNSFITVSEDYALAQARVADESIAKGTSSILTGIPFAQKDIFCTRGVKTTCGSKMLDNFIAPYDATVIHKFNQAGSVMLGKTNMDEFA